MKNLREQLALANGFAACAPQEAVARARYVEAAARESMTDAADERGELQSIARLAARRVKDYEHLWEQRQQEVRARHRSYREREYRALELPLPPKPWGMPGAYGERARRTSVLPSAREQSVDAAVATPASELVEAF